MEERFYQYDKTEMGKRLKEIRKGKYTQETLADALQVSVESVSKYERGKTEIPHDIICQLCKLFQVSSDYFYFGLREQEVLTTPDPIINKMAELVKNLSVEDQTKALNILAAFVA